MRYPIIDVRATGRKIQQLREEKNLSVQEVSDYMGFMQPQAVYKWQSGKTLPTVDNLYALSKLFETTIEEIIVEKGEDDVSSSFCDLNYEFI